MHSMRHGTTSRCFPTFGSRKLKLVRWIFFDGIVGNSGFLWGFSQSGYLTSKDTRNMTLHHGKFHVGALIEVRFSNIVKLLLNLFSFGPELRSGYLTFSNTLVSGLPLRKIKPIMHLNLLLFFLLQHDIFLLQLFLLFLLTLSNFQLCLQHINLFILHLHLIHKLAKLLLKLFLWLFLLLQLFPQLIYITVPIGFLL